MKKIFLLFVFASLFISCDDNPGPRPSVRMPNRSEKQILNDVLDAEAGDKWYYKYDTELYTVEDGDWVYAGAASVYSNFADNDDGCDLWVDFGEPFRFPAERTSRGGYNYRVKYRGVNYYF